MSIETLVATIDRDDLSLMEKMNIQTDALVGNQCGRNSTEELYYHGNRIVYLNTAQRGVGRNRNLLLENASADICILADDDMRFVDGYPETAKAAFGECPDADILVFNLIEKHPRRHVNDRVMRIRSYNYAKYGAARIAFRRQRLISKGLRFDINFGGGTRHGSGEDTIFLRDCLKKGLKIYAAPYYLAEIDQEAPSTWFEGYDGKFFADKGALYARLHPLAWPVYALRYVIRYAEKYRESMTPAQGFKHMLTGGRAYRREAEE